MTEPTAMPRPPAKEPLIRRFLTFRRGPWENLATVVIAKWEGEFIEASDEALDLAAARGEI